MSLKEGAKVIVETCMGIKPKEKVLIITSSGLMNNASLLAEEAEALNATVTIIRVKPKDMEIEPPEHVCNEMFKSDVILASLPPSLIQIFLHTNARNAATQKGARIGGIAYIRKNITKKDIYEITDLTERLAIILTNGKSAKITTSEGTNVSMSIKNRISAPLRVRHVIPGAWGALPDYAEAAIAPVEGTANGIAIINVFFEKVGAIKNPIKWTIKNGRVVQVEGAQEAEKIKHIIEAADENGNNIAELGIGTNHVIKQFTGTVGDKMVKGTAHLAIGKNINIGGQTYSNIHHDGVMNNVTIEIDEKIIIEDGKFLI